MPDSFWNFSRDGILLPLTSMYSGQLEKKTCFSESDLSVLLHSSDSTLVPEVPHALSSVGSPRPSEAIPAPRRNRRRSTSDIARMVSGRRRGRRDDGMRDLLSSCGDNRTLPWWRQGIPSLRLRCA